MNLKQIEEEALHLSEDGRWLQRVVQGHINYCGVAFNAKALNQFVEEVKRLWLLSHRR